MSLVDSFLNLLAPYECLGCGKEGSLLCRVCSGEIMRGKTRISPGNVLKINSPAVYEGLAKDLVWKLKSAGAQSAADVMASHMKYLLPKRPGLIIVPVPTATSRVRQRGYDQAWLIAKALSRQTGVRCSNCLLRYGQSHQVGANRHQRLQQLENVFGVRAGKVSSESNIILVDDVTTTGATLEAAASVFMRLGVQYIEAITFAQA